MSRREHGSLLEIGSPVGTLLWSQTHRGRRMHSVGCAVDGFPWHHGDVLPNGRRFTCHRCAEDPDRTIEGLIRRRER